MENTQALKNAEHELILDVEHVETGAGETSLPIYLTASTSSKQLQWIKHITQICRESQPSHDTFHLH